MRLEVHLALAREAGDIAKLEQSMIRDVVDGFHRYAQPYRFSFGLVALHRAAKRSGRSAAAKSAAEGC